MLKMDYDKLDVEIKNGEYEVFVQNYEQTTTSTGKKMIILDYEIRDDVDQECKGLKVRFDNFVVSDETEWRFLQVGKAANLPKDMQFETHEEWAKTMLNKCLRIQVGKREYQGREYATVEKYMKSDVAPLETEVVKVSDEDLPF
ncbi:DUF669 domain-containing protein [Bacillus sp. FSL W7-1360]